MRQSIRLRVNGVEHSVSVAPATPLLDTLRDELGLTAAKESCGKGECGSCTVLMDGEPVCSCLVLTAQAEGADLITVEGIGTPGAMAPVQAAFVASGAAQCGYCIPGFIAAAHGFLLRHPRATEAEIREALAGNICRCTGYQKILEAVAKAAPNYGAKAGEDVRSQGSI